MDKDKTIEEAVRKWFALCFENIKYKKSKKVNKRGIAEGEIPSKV